jgi:hypothetical protein
LQMDPVAKGGGLGGGMGFWINMVFFIKTSKKINITELKQKKTPPWNTRWNLII